MTSRNKTDLELIEQFKAGDLRAFEKLVFEYANKVFSLSLRLTKNQEDAEEVLQDVFVSLYRKIDGFRGQSTFSSWLYRVAVNASFMRLRKNRQDKSVKFDDLSIGLQESLIGALSNRDEVTEIVNAKELKGVLKKAINSLPGAYKAVFVLRDIDGLSTVEVARMLKITTPAVKSRLHRSRIMLRKKLKPFYDEFCRGKENAQGARLVSNI